MLLCLIFPVTLLIPGGSAVVVALIGLAFASLLTAGLAIFREKERSVLVVVFASLTFLLVVTYAVGEFLVGH